MLSNPTRADVTDDLKSAVVAYLLARVHAEILRGQVDAVQRAVLKECPLTNGHESKHGKPAMDIIDPKLTYLCDDDSMMQEYWNEVDRRLREKGIKPESMERDYCPALVAEEVQRQAELLVIGCGCDMFKLEITNEEFHHRLLCSGMDKYHKYVDLLVRLCLTFPDVKARCTLEN